MAPTNQRGIDPFDGWIFASACCFFDLRKLVICGDALTDGVRDFTEWSAIGPSECRRVANPRLVWLAHTACRGARYPWRPKAKRWRPARGLGWIADRDRQQRRRRLVQRTWGALAIPRFVLFDRAKLSARRRPPQLNGKVTAQGIEPYPSGDGIDASWALSPPFGQRQSVKRPPAEQQTTVSVHVPTIESGVTARPVITIFSSNDAESPRMILYWRGFRRAT